MKKLLVGIIIVIALSMFNDTSLGTQIIPDEAIRLRILANSNSDYDQKIKNEVKDELQSDMYSLLKDTKKIDDARTIINTNMNYFDKKIGSVLSRENYKLGYAIDYGYHYFPEKEYNGVTYKAGDYESVLVTLGKGEGDNWWCVLFPPLCLLEAKESSHVEYKFFIKDIIDKFFGKH